VVVVVVADPRGPEGYNIKGYNILYLYPKVAKKGYFLSLFGAGYFGDLGVSKFYILYPF
jgi:hypothetical protein